MFRTPPITLLGLLATGPLMAQADTPSTAMVPPMDIPLVLAGNFMELRAGHFHSGLDIKTEGREGVPVKAVKDGFVSRIRSSPWGFGKALYVEHADGTTTVYGHLSRFAGAIAEAALKAHYEGQTASIDVQPPSGNLPVKQGQVIAWSGNAGGSSAPHLHFELRRNSDQHAIDPQAHGIDLPDTTPPDIYGVRIYPLDSLSRVSPYPGKAVGFAAQKLNGSYTLDPEVRIAATGTIGLAVHTIDRYDNSSNKCGVRRIELFVDSVPAFSVRLDEINFDLNRYCDAHMDYALYKDQDMHYHRLYKLPNDPLAIYGNEALQGRIPIKSGDARRIRIVITDTNGNSSTIAFILNGANPDEARPWLGTAHDGTPFSYARENRLDRDDVRLVLPPLALYDDLDFHYQRLPAPRGARAPVHALQNALTPIRLAAQLSIKADDVPQELRDKALIVRIDGPGRYAAQGGTWDSGWVSTSIRDMGQYTIMIDSVPPKITPIDVKPDMSGRYGFTILVADGLSGIDHWTAMLDGKWILMEYDPKLKTLVHHFDVHSEGTGERSLRLEVFDERKNSSTYAFTFSR